MKVALLHAAEEDLAEATASLLDPSSSRSPAVMSEHIAAGINSPVELLAKLTGMFPEFSSEFEADEEVTTYHQVILRLASVITAYLQETPTRIERFCDLVNAMVAAGGVKENAISTCLLDHASQVSLRKTIRPYLSAAAREQLR